MRTLLSTITALLFGAAIAHGDEKGDAVFIFNTYQNTGFTGTSEAVYEEATATISDEVEFELFPEFFDGGPEGFYNIDFVADGEKGGTCTFTLKNGTGSLNQVYLNGEYDRYYIGFTKPIKSVTLGETSNYNAEVKTYSYKKVPTVDMFNKNLTFPDYISNNVFLLEFKAGSNLTEPEQTIVVTYEFGEVEDSTTRSSSEVSIYNTYQGSFSGYEEIFFEEAKATISNETEFIAFPRHPSAPDYGFYDVDIALDSMNPNKIQVSWTINNSSASGGFGNYTFDRYFVTFDKPLESVEVTRSDNFTVQAYIPANKTSVNKSFSSNTVVLEIFEGTDLSIPDQKVILEVMVKPIEFEVDENEVIAFNGYRNSNKTGGVMTVYYKASATIGDGLEFELFPPNPPGKPEGGFYDIDISQSKEGGTISFTLKDNRGASNPVFDAGEYDKYFFFFPETIESVEVVEAGSFKLRTYVPEYMEMSTVDLFGTGLEFPSVLGNNVVVIDLQVGTDLNTIGGTFSVEYKMKKKDKGDKDCDDETEDISIYNSYQGSFVGYDEFGFEASSATLSDDVEFSLFPINPKDNSSGFYDINITMMEEDMIEGFADVVSAFAESKNWGGFDKDYFGDEDEYKYRYDMDRVKDSIKAKKGTITFTLMDNTGASNIVSQPSEFDRYYITFEDHIYYAKLVTSDNLKVDVSVKKYQGMGGLLGNSAPGAPEFYEENTIVVEIGEGSNLTQQGQVVQIEFGLAGYDCDDHEGDGYGNPFGIPFLDDIFEVISYPFVFLFGLCF